MLTLHLLVYKEPLLNNVTMDSEYDQTVAVHACGEMYNSNQIT